MPTIRCTACKRLQRIPTKKAKLLPGDDTPYVCSADCVLTLIRKVEKKNDQPKIPFGSIENNQWDPNQRPAWRSLFEERFARWLMSQQIAFHYEHYVFNVGDGFYIPDFYLPQSGLFIETKGLWRMGQKKKFWNFKKQHPSIPILVVSWLIQKDF